MGKKIFAASLLIVFAAAALIAQEASLTITAPHTGDPLLRGSTCTIRWTHSAYYDVHPGQNVVIFCGSSQIGTPVPAIQNMFDWTVGRKSDGTWLPAGTYEITLESLDYDALNGPSIQIYFLVFKPDFLHRPLEFKKNPECPMCYSFDPRLMEIEMEGLDLVRLELWQSGRKLADLGKFVGGKAQSGPVKFQLDSRIGRQETGVELRAFSSRGALLLNQKMQSALTGR
jgi:hypothetical protein